MLERLELPTSPELAPYRAHLLASAHLGLGRREEALAALGDYESSHGCRRGWEDPLHTRREVLRAEIIAHTAPGTAAGILAALGDDSARLERAIGLAEQAGETGLVSQLERRLLTRLPGTPEALAAATRLGPSIKERLKDTEDRLERIRQLLDTHDNERALAEASAFLAEPAGKRNACELHYVIGRAHRKLRQYAPAIDALARARARCRSTEPEGDFQARSALLEINVRTIRGDVRGAERTLAWLKKHHPNHSFIDDAMFLVADLKDRRKDWTGAERLYRQMLEEYPHGDQAAAAAWRLAFGAIQRDDAKAATEHLNQVLGSKVDRLVDRHRAQYWLGRMLERSDAKAATEDLREVARGLTFYGFVAIAHLERSHPEAAAAVKRELLEVVERGTPVSPSLPTAIIDTEAHKVALKLFQVGEPELAERHLLRLDCPGLTAREALALAFSFDAVGAYAASQRIMRRHAKTLLTRLDADQLQAWYAAYSRPYESLVAKAAQAEKVEPLLLLALVREESTFDPAIVSWAGAVGLAQVMPATAAQAFAQVFRGRLDPARLTEPELNLRLGARVLGDGLRAFAQQEPLALGAYNAGARNVRRWLTPEGRPFDLWSEEVTIKETRGYIQRVLETWGIYRLLYDERRPFLKLPATVRASSRGTR